MRERSDGTARKRRLILVPEERIVITETGDTLDDSEKSLAYSKVFSVLVGTIDSDGTNVNELVVGLVEMAAAELTDASDDSTW